MTASATVSERTWRETTATAARRVSAVTAAGGLLGLIVGGAGGRLAMFALARLNPEVKGLQSDDDFTMGQFTTATLNLLFVTTLIGVVGGAVYLLLRGLMIGPRWFQVLSVSLGPAVVVGAQIVHTDGIDFTLDPGLLAVAMFVLIPGVYAALLTVLAERWLRDDAFFATAPTGVALLPLLLWVPIAPLLLLLGAVLAAYELVRRSPRGRAVVARPVWRQLARALLAVIFTVSLVGLLQDATTIA
jgi:hypothetical protein